MIRLTSALLFFCLCLTACNFLKTGGSVEWMIPEDSGSPQEHARLNTVIDLVKQDFKSEGIPLDIQIPIIIFNRSVPGVGEPGGFCMYENDNSTPRAIGISGGVVRYSMDNPDWFPKNAGEDYAVLLHEIGHCYFNRPHDYEYFRIADSKIVITETAPNGTDVPIELETLPKSAMNIGVTLILSNMRSYYVREIAGLDRISTLEDLKRYNSRVKVVPNKSLLR